MKKYFIFTLIIILIAGGWIFFRKKHSETNHTFDFTPITRGNLENVISGTGTLSAVGTVEVGTQVSGTISELLVDFNDTVKAGQVLAVLDTTFLSASVREARAKVNQCQAQYNQAVIDLKREKELFEKGYSTAAKYESSQNTAALQQAALMSAQAGLDRARVNLEYAVITSPIDGTIIHREVEPGQTVAASLSAPVLFLVARDLSKMEIMGLVDESDIGQIKVGQEVRFTVDAYLDREFAGQVRQIRLQPETVSSVVNYTVVIDADNPDGLLFPGMTATVDFIVEKKENVLLIANKALRFMPSAEMLQNFQKQMLTRRETIPDSLKKRRSDRRDLHPGGFPPNLIAGDEAISPGREDMAQLWYLAENGDLGLIVVHKGATNGSETEIIPLPPRGPMADQKTAAAGLEIITGILEAGAEKSSNQPNSQRRMIPPPF